MMYPKTRCPSASIAAKNPTRQHEVRRHEHLPKGRRVPGPNRDLGAIRRRHQLCWHMCTIALETILLLNRLKMMYVHM
jgi:hypothetical protein